MMDMKQAYSWDSCCLLTGTSIDENKENKVAAAAEKKRNAFPGLCIPDQLTENTTKVREIVK